MELEQLKRDLIANSKKYDELVFERNDLNVKIIGLESVIGYIKAVIDVEEGKLVDKEKEVKKSE